MIKMKIVNRLPGDLYRNLSIYLFKIYVLRIV